jgi:hypothetical protein
MRIIRWTLAAFLLAGAIALEAPLEPLDAQDCVVVARDGETRSCTATEQMGQCLYNAVDSYRSCQEFYIDWWISWVCEAYFAWDAAICIIEAGLPFEE